MQGSPSGVELQLQLQNQALERAARELRSEIEQLREQLAELREQLADLQRRQTFAEVAWLARLTHRVAALELQATGRAGPAPFEEPTPPASPQED